MTELPTRYTDVLDWLDFWWSWAKDLPVDETPPLELPVLDKLEAAHQQASELPDVYSGVRLEPLKEFLHELRRYYDPFATHLQPFRRQYGDQQASRDELLTLRGLAIANMREIELLAQQTSALPQAHLPGKLTDRESTIVEAIQELGSGWHSRNKILRFAGWEPSGSLFDLMTQLVKRGILESSPRGYRIPARPPNLG